MANNTHSVVIDTSGSAPRSPAGATPFDTGEPELAREFLSRLGGGVRKTTAAQTVIPNMGVLSGQNSPMLEPRPAGGVRPNNSTDPRHMVVSVGGVEMSLADAQRLGLVRQGAGGAQQFTPEVEAAKVAEGRKAAEATDAEAMTIADQETAEWLEGADRACRAAGMEAGLDDLVHACFRADSDEGLVEVFAGISPDPQETAAEFGNLVGGWLEGLAGAMNVDGEELTALLDRAVETHGMGAVVGRALAGAHRQTYAPIIAMLRNRRA